MELEIKQAGLRANKKYYAQKKQEEEEKKLFFVRKRDKLRRLEDELKGWEKILPSARFVSRDGPNARAPHFASKLERRIFEFSKIILSLQ